VLRAGLQRKEESFYADAENGTHLEENQTNRGRDYQNQALSAQSKKSTNSQKMLGYTTI